MLARQAKLDDQCLGPLAQVYSEADTEPKQQLEMSRAQVLDC